MIRFEAISDILQFIAADLIFQIGSCQFVNATDMIRSKNLLILEFIYMKQRVKSRWWKNCGAEQKKKSPLIMENMHFSIKPGRKQRSKSGSTILQDVNHDHVLKLHQVSIIEI